MATWRCELRQQDPVPLRGSVDTSARLWVRSRLGGELQKYFSIRVLATGGHLRSNDGSFDGDPSGLNRLEPGSKLASANLGSGGRA
jgi:hypothetical protein